MASLSEASFCHCGFLTYLVLFSFYISIASSVSLDLSQLRNKVAKIKVNPRGSLWATGHFMGKKSVVDSERLPTEDDSTMKAVEAALNPQQVEPADLFQEMLRIALQTRLDSPEIRAKVPGTAILMKILDSYIQDNKK
ncbi:neuromedin-B-like [Carassius auratus]|uniref:Neuromedin-B-like n=1 Tax=Carassius auratus TaxID=7957 RepID=A0A6P6MSF0_CARAU|nr:neuromedin-B-like [Carassius auratus]XP_026099497.1 neuromedin-B-like [Carassius auratus]XP_052456760.1 neuromedin-B-like [Carassius gibelio]